MSDDSQTPATIISYIMLGHCFSRESWEAVCTGCGHCCYEKWDEDGKIRFSDTPCRYLDSDNRCKVYPRRFQICHDCDPVTPELILQGQLLPPECGYMKLAEKLKKKLAKLEASQEPGGRKLRRQ